MLTAPLPLEGWVSINLVKPETSASWCGEVCGEVCVQIELFIRPQNRGNVCGEVWGEVCVQVEHVGTNDEVCVSPCKFTSLGNISKTTRNLSETSRKPLEHLSETKVNAKV